MIQPNMVTAEVVPYILQIKRVERKRGPGGGGGGVLGIYTCIRIHTPQFYLNILARRFVCVRHQWSRTIHSLNLTQSPNYTVYLCNNEERHYCKSFW